MDYIAEPIARLINQLGRLPGVGGKTAQRLAYHIIAMEEQDVRELAEAIFLAKKKTTLCETCLNVTDKTPCNICTDSRRDRRTICVVGTPKDVLAIEKLREYKGLYHVLHGSISPMDGIGPDELKIKELLKRLDNDIQEIIIATNTDVEGEATATYISRLIKPMGVKVSRIAHGVPIGGNLEYTDEITLIKAIEGRREM